MVYILAEIVTKHIKQQLIFNYAAKMCGYSALFQTNCQDKQAVTSGRKKQMGFASLSSSQQNG